MSKGGVLKKRKVQDGWQKGETPSMEKRKKKKKKKKKRKKKKNRRGVQKARTGEYTGSAQ